MSRIVFTCIGAPRGRYGVGLLVDPAWNGRFLISVFFFSPTIYSPLETEALRRDRLSVSIKRVPLFILPSNIFLALQNVVVVWVPSSTGVQLYMLYFSIFKLQHLLVIGAPDIPTVHFLCRIWPKEIKHVFIPRRPEYSRRGAKMENRGIRPNFYSSVWFLFYCQKPHTHGEIYILRKQISDRTENPRILTQFNVWLTLLSPFGYRHPASDCH